MLIQFNPTEKLSAILRNNTSAADSFPGWPNGIAKPSAVGGGAMPVPQKYRMLHRVNWWSTGVGRSTSHPDIGISSFDPAYAAKTVAYFCDYLGYNVFSQLWHGPTNTNHKAALAQMPELAKRGLHFLICIGSSAPTLKLPPANYPTFTTAQRTVELNKLLDVLRTTFFSSPAYLRRNGRPMLQFFGIEGVDWPTVTAHALSFGADAPEFWFRIENDGKHHDRREAAGFFGWRSSNQAWVDFAQQFNKPLMLGVNASFDSSHAELPVHCTWGNTDKRDPLGGLRWVDQLGLAAANPQIDTLMGCTADDLQEGSAQENGIATGFTLTLAIANNVLEWNPPTAAFDHVTVYLSQDGEGLMPLAQTPVAGGVTSLDLAQLEIPDGIWTLVAVAYGKHLMQHVAASITETLGWRP